jgi:hypothetical protein
MHALARWTAAAALAVTASGCYHATIETGAAPGTDTITIPWAHGFIYGLVPPSVVNAAQRCPRGVAKVETQMSFLNGLASAVTFGIYTPMQIDVTCSGGGGRDDASAIPAGDDAAAALTRAVERARETGQPVYVKF